MAAWAPDDPTWDVIKPVSIPPVRRGTTKRRGRARGMHMAQFWAMDKEEREITYAISKVGRRAEPRIGR